MELRWESGFFACSGFERRHDRVDLFIEVCAFVPFVSETDEDAFSHHRHLVSYEVLAVLLEVQIGDIVLPAGACWQPAQARALVRPGRPAIAGPRAPDGHGLGGRPVQLQHEGNPPALISDAKPLQHGLGVEDLGLGRQPEMADGKWPGGEWPLPATADAESAL